MKTNRTYALLMMLYRLEEEGFFLEEKICIDLGISRASFYRALNDFRCFLQEYRPWQELKADREGHYRLIAIGQKEGK